MADPLPCPFCGGTAVGTMFDAAQGRKWGAALCCECGALGPDVRTDYDKGPEAPWRAEAIAAWNRRATRTADMQAAYLAGFMSSGEGGNGEYPYRDRGLSPLDDDEWLADRDKNLAALGVTKKEAD